MPVPTTLASLSTTAASNSPSGGENPFPDLDDHIRAGYAFDAQNRDAIATKLNASAVSAFGLTLVDDADAATARATLGAAGLTGAETVAGVKTFSSSPIAPTPTTGDNTTKVATTAFVKTTADAAVADRARLYQPAAQATTSGTEVTFSSIPSWAKRITVMFSGVSGAAAGSVKVRALVGGVEVTSGYTGTYFFFGSGTSADTVTDAFCRYDFTNGAANLHGHTVLTLMGSNTWTCNGSVARHGGVAEFQEHAGSAALSGAITDIRVLCTGTTFDGGSVSILVEG